MKKRFKVTVSGQKIPWLKLLGRVDEHRFIMYTYI